MNVSDELQRLQQLHQSGALTDEEFAHAKARLLNSSGTPEPRFASAPADIEQKSRLWAMFLHLSQLGNFVVPLAGFILPIVLWQIKKAELPNLDAHGKVVVNWMVTSVIYGMIGVILCIVLIGIPLLIALGLICIIFPIIGGVKANNGEVWKYPLSISIVK